MEKYKINKDEDGSFLSLPNNGGEVGDLTDIRDELNKLVDKINQANKLLAAVKAGYHGENYCEDVDGANWFDLAEEFLKENK